jgi:hypothetical protein
MGEAVDYSYARPNPQALVNAGYEVVLRYLGRDARCITRDELHRLHNVGLKVSLIGQTTILRPLSGYAGGQTDASYYNGLADALGAPDWLPIFYVVDVGTENGRSFPKPEDHPAIRSYVSGILSHGRRPVGMYGPYPILEMLRDLDVNGRRIHCWWQTAGASGSGSGTGGGIRTGDGSVRRLSNLACMFQHYSYPTGTSQAQRDFGSSIDHNSILMRPIEWAWNPADQRKDELMGKAVGADSVEGLWEITHDGFGRRRRTKIESPAMQRLLVAAEVIESEALHLTGEESAEFASIPPANADHLADTGALALTMNVLARLETLSTQVAGVATADIDEAELAAKVKEFLTDAALAPAIARATIDQLRTELSD